MNKIAIVDDHIFLIKGISSILEYEYSNPEIKGFVNPIDFLREINNNSFDLIILDLSFSKYEIDGFYVLEEIKRRKIETPVIIYSGEEDNAIISKAINLGANGFLSKDEVAEKLIEAIEVIKNNTLYIPQNLYQKIVDINIDKIDFNILSNREKEVLLLINEGLKNIEIAEKLGITPNSVTTYKKRIKDKLFLLKFK